MLPSTGPGTEKALFTTLLYGSRLTAKFTCSNVLDQERERQGEEGEVEPDWSRYPEAAAASVAHHTSILRNKRLLLIYTCALALHTRPQQQQRGKVEQSQSRSASQHVRRVRLHLQTTYPCEHA